jgi:glycosyltransferase involved in cell wall biosynthesis
VSDLRFCFLTTFYPPYNFGGDGIAVQRLARGLVARGCDVTVVHDRDAYRALSGGHDPARTQADPGLHVVGLESRLGKLSLLLTHQCGRPVVHARRIRRLLREGRFDVLTFHNVSLIGGPGLMSYGGDVAKIYMAHEHWLVCESHTLWRHNRERCTGRECVRCALSYGRPPQLWRKTDLVARHARSIDTFVAMSDFSRRKHREFGFDRDMEVLPPLPPPLPPAADAGEESPHGRPYFFFAGRLERLKGLDDVIDVFGRFEAADLIVAGEGEHGAELRRRAAGNTRVIFLGRVAPDALHRYYRHARAVIVPSVGYETFGLTTVEAFQHRTPVVVRRVGPLPEIVEGAGAGEVFDNAEQLMAALARLAADGARRAAFGDAAFRAYEQHYAEDVVVPRFLELAERAMARRGSRRAASAA